ncbi:L-seryl-tRNA(Sec) selenium transferase [Paenalkalicoccus suaedae]|uniref:L-seryl-tRNA(Sec) selenium transferase n=1 Tax=Paenalkalicoccus suaedae TaxID=2592382 RepID=A0A859FGI3_9BACI|nr:L-seryl-tRNA(Sec) selenium transferase [Paenalkalicoccus suaedae]QKS71336.1 L-seryl-tRNA(Sec) selenium transferase [Paenalkalicoccus suaedae]
MAKEQLRLLPPIHELLDRVSDMLREEHVSELRAKEWFTEELAQLREDLLQTTTYHTYDRKKFTDLLLARFNEQIGKLNAYNLQSVINATGTVLHTNLGRARLSKKAADHVYEIATSYSNLEYDLEAGKRGSRLAVIEELLAKASGAEAAIVVNNNAAAVYFVLSAFAKNQEVLVSRGELVEIGGSFRVSSIMEESGAQLKEVGTTNKTHLHDYLDNRSDQTAMIMKVHTSNFAVVGFTKSVSSGEIKTALLDEGDTDTLVFDDLGSGSLHPFIHEGIGDEPLISTALKSGCDLVSFSGDKLLGGPQAGIIAGRADLIQKLKKHQLARVLRVDKMTLAALEATLTDYVYGNSEAIPTVSDIRRDKDDIMSECSTFVSSLSLSSVQLEQVEDLSKVGGGTMPLVELPTAGLVVKHPLLSASRLETYFRSFETPIIGRIRSDMYFLDFRTLTADDQKVVKRALTALDNEFL